MSRSVRKRCTLFATLVASAAALVALAVFVGAGTAASAAAPTNTSPPTITGTAEEGQTLTGNRGEWSGTVSEFSYFWMRCNKNGNECVNISNATRSTYTVRHADIGNTLRFKVRAQNADGRTFASSAPTAVVTASTSPPQPPSGTGCPAGSGTIQVTDLAPPARLLVDAQQSNPSVVTGGTQQVTLRYHVSACGGRSVQGALVYATAVPFNQLSIPAEQPTASDGWASLDFHMLSGFPASPHQQLLAIFVRARKSGENPLGGISTRRLFSVPVHL
jgi:hypothetical protein